jgi:ergosteryl-3beta-O-L-aspartate synthase
MSTNPLKKLSQKLHSPNGDGRHQRHGSADIGAPASHSPHRRSLAQILHLDNSYTSSDNESETSDFDSDGPSKNQQKRMATKAKKKEARSRLSLEHRDDSEERSKQRLEDAAKIETPEMRARYGDLPIMQSTTRGTQQRIDINNITEDMVGQEVTFRSRLYHFRNMGTKLVFLIFRQNISTIQGVMVEKPGEIGPLMMHWAEHLRTGSIVLVTGTLKKPEIPVKSASIHTVEVHVHTLKIIVKRQEPVPFSVQEAEMVALDDAHKEEGRQSQIPNRTRLSNRIIDLRTTTSQSIFRIQSGIGNLFRSTLDDRGFVEIHTPKLQGAATESGASVFNVNYFGRKAFLAQSPQLAKQMAIASDFERVYEIGAVFRAENSNTHRHLTEFTGLDLEMAIEEHYHEMLDVIDATLKAIFKGIYTRYRREVDVIKEQFPSDDLVWLDKTPVIPFKDAVQMLTDSGWLNEEGEPVSPLEDLGTRDEIRIGELVKEKYGTDYYVLDKFPRSARPFYTMPDADDPRYTNSFDIFVRGQEIISGSQRIHDATMLEENMRLVGIDPEDMAEYMEGFRWGAPPHGGCGVGLERILFLLLKLGNIRLASMFHRDPKSFPPKAVVEKLPYPDADTLNPVWKRERGRETAVEDRPMPSVEDLIANYGDSTHTSWGDERFKVWRHADTGAAISYVVEGTHAILPGDPLCAESQYYRVIVSFLQWLKKETHLKPIWILINTATEEVLGERLGWKTISCVAEERVDPTKHSAESDPEVAKKIRQAQNNGLKITDIDSKEPVPESVKERANARVKDWLNNRKGTQIHLSNIELFRDEKHRRYFIAEDKEGTLCGIAVLAQVAPQRGYVACPLSPPLPMLTCPPDGKPSTVWTSLVLHRVPLNWSLLMRCALLRQWVLSQLPLVAALRRTLLLATTCLARR